MSQIRDLQRALHESKRECGETKQALRAQQQCVSDVLAMNVRAGGPRYDVDPKVLACEFCYHEILSSPGILCPCGELNYCSP